MHLFPKWKDAPCCEGFFSASVASFDQKGKYLPSARRGRRNFPGCFPKGAGVSVSIGICSVNLSASFFFSLTALAVLAILFNPAFFSFSSLFLKLGSFTSLAISGCLANLFFHFYDCALLSVHSFSFRSFYLFPYF